jgi:hypothetical protein
MLGKPLAQVRGNYCRHRQLMCFDRTGEPAGKTLRRERNLDVSPGRISRIWLTEAPGEYHHRRQQRGPPVHSLLVTAGVPPRRREACRWGTIVYFGSRAEAMPASKIPNLVSAEAASSEPPAESTTAM